MIHPGPWRVEFVDGGGYDCMTDAWYIKDANGRCVVALDLSSYGASARGGNPPGVVEQVEEVARFIAEAGARRA